ncbi:phage tail protein [Kistimonas scapharcae]|uniref:Phage tail protein n=1 Tax=Kistimonas scapharcae TaxID=1036133 RepID=A0ABP8UZQ7_9GAMM
MTPEQPKRPDIQLPVWQEGQPEPAIDAPEGELVKFARVMDKWWNQVQAWLYWPLTGFDVDNAPLVIVDMIAWQRDIDRYPGEPEWLYRRRVKHAKANAEDAGSVIGFKRIWERMELGYIELDERIPGQDWDIIRLNITETLIAERPELLDIIIRMYGRTCRRYEWTTIAPLTLTMRCIAFHDAQQCMVASIED